MANIKNININSLKSDITILKSDVNIALIALTVIFISSVAYDYYWVKANTAPPSWDQSTHMINSLAYYNVLTNPSADMLGKLLAIDTYYPPLYHLSTGIFNLFFGTSSDTSIMVNTVYLGILLFSIYGLGSRLFDKKTGVIAALLISLFPAISNLQRDFLIDFALISMVSLAVYLLVASDYFKNVKYSLMFGVAFALAILTKWTAIFFIIGPLCYILLQTFISMQKDKKCYYCGKEIQNELIYSDHSFCSDRCKKGWKKYKTSSVSVNNKRIITIVSSLLLAFAIASIWYIPNISNVYKSISEGQLYWGTIEGDPEVYTIASFVYYFFATFNSISFIFSLLAVAGLVVLLKKKDRSSLILYLIIAIPYIVFTLLRNKDGRYLIPIAISLSIMGAVFLSSIKDKRLFTSAILLVSLLGVVQLFPYEFGLKSMSIKSTYGPIFLFGPEANTPIKQDWKVEEIMQDMLVDAKSNNRILTRGFGYIGVIPDMPYVNGLTYNHYSYSNKLPFNVINGVYLGFDNFASNLFNFDYIIVKSGKNEYSPYNAISDNIRDYFYNNKGDKYILLKQYELPENTTLFTYKNVIT